VLNFTVTLPVVSLSVVDDSEETTPGSSALYEMTVTNDGTSSTNLTLAVGSLPAHLTARVYTGSLPDANSSDSLSLIVDGEDSITVFVEVLVWPTADAGEWEVPVELYYLETQVAALTLTITVT
jgi:uncharacterized membrane protein